VLFAKDLSRIPQRQRGTEKRENGEAKEERWS
jgi:hypothetical protein